MKACTGRAFLVNGIAEHPENATFDGDIETRALQVRLRGRGGLSDLVIALNDLPEVISVNVVSPQRPSA